MRSFVGRVCGFSAAKLGLSKKTGLLQRRRDRRDDFKDLRQSSRRKALRARRRANAVAS